MADFLAGRVVVLRVDSRADYMVRRMVWDRAAWMAVNWVQKIVGYVAG